MTPEVFLRLRENELRTLYAHQKAIASRDKDKRRRAMTKYRAFLGWLVDVRRITPEQAAQLEAYRMEDRHL